VLPEACRGSADGEPRGRGRDVRLRAELCQGAVAPDLELDDPVRARGGRIQATYAGKPLYYYVGDRRPGQILCQNVNEYGGLWLVLRPSGAFVR